ncbi:MAG: endolytic transglycosylase MltG [Armatimonadetes bacterium]|nr:endolytic transglycosylase MltG [Armatimonadota bacterium]
MMWKWVKGVLAFLLAAGIIAGAGFSYLSGAIHRPLNPQGEPVVFVIMPGAPSASIARELEERRIIKSALYFRIAARLARGENRIKTGEYRIGSHMSPAQILDKFMRGEVVTHRLTIPEGYNNRQIAELLDQSGITPKDEFLTALAGRSCLLTPEGTESLPGLEGCLFPDTYFFPLATPAENVIGTLTNRFRELLLSLLARKPTTPLRLREAIILASLIEMEARVPEEYPIISAVYHNRLRIGMRLECDATIQFLLSSPKEFLLYSDLSIPSPYNTYLHDGLPPGPICNPGLRSLEAALFPSKVDYLYYVVKGDSGAHMFSRTYEGHLQAVEKYRKWLEIKPQGR